VPRFRRRKLLRSSVLIVFVVLLGGVLGLWFRPAFTPHINAERSVAELRSLRLGEFEQSILVRGHDVHKPVLLFLHGGPGMPAMYLAHAFQRELEHNFVVVHWDRLGAGKSYREGIPPAAMSVEREIADARELCEYLRKRFGEQPLLLVGHSYGTYLGVRLAQRHPELFAAYVGIGQVADPARERMVQLEFLTQAAAAAGDREYETELRGATPDIEAGLFKYGAELRDARSWWPLLWLGLRAPEYSGRDVLNVQKGVSFTQRHIQYDNPSRALSDVSSLAVPVFLFEGRHDFTTPSSLGAAFLEQLEAPHKELIWFEESAHFPFLEEPEKFTAEVLRVAARVGLQSTRRAN
jgi:pimeloyl-ACP methyl ester carboxylesterase